jgi:ferrous iron transport protein B
MTCHDGAPRPRRGKAEHRATAGADRTRRPDHLTVALAGNPNTGKSTVFNALTGSHQHVGNWPGKTVERKSGTWRPNGRDVEVVDLPGTYSLSAYSLEETIARDYLADGSPDVVVVVVDAANLERNLYLAVQILESGANVVLALNMVDAAEAQGIRVDVPGLAARLGVPVVAMTARSDRGLDDLESAVLATAPGVQLHVDYGRDVEAEIDRLVALVASDPGLATLGDPRWLAIGLLEEDAHTLARVRLVPGGAPVLAGGREAAERLRQHLGEDPDTLVAGGRYGWINGLVREVVRRPAREALTPSERIDRIVTHRLLGIPIFLLAMWAVFKLTSDVARPYLDWIAGVIGGPVTRWAGAALGALGLGGTWVERLVLDGAIAGVGGVLAFVPVLMSLYLVLSLLEDSGYMARAAFVMDRLMRTLGLHGKSFLPMLVGFGCNVPAIYATRTLRDERDRVLTGLLVPFMSCGARLPVYVLFAAVFFPAASGTVVFAMYLVGIATAVAVGLALSRTVFRDQAASAFVMELPPYRLPTPRSIWFHMWGRTSAFVRKAWTMILGMSVAVWLLMAIPTAGGHFAETDLDDSLFARASGAIAPVFAPLGFGTWQASGALFSGIVAKEVVVSTLAQVHAVPGQAAVPGGPASFGAELRDVVTGFGRATADTLRTVPLVVGIDLRGTADRPAPSELAAALRTAFDASSGGHGARAALAFMIFVLLYTPCMVAVAAERQELGARWMWLSVLGQFALGWLAALAVYQGAGVLGLG